MKNTLIFILDAHSKGAKKLWINLLSVSWSVFDIIMDTMYETVVDQIVLFS